MDVNRQVKGILGEKLGMTQVFDEANRIVPVTVVKAGPCVVTQVRTPASDGYSAVQIAYGAIDPRKVNKPTAGHFAKAGVPPRRHVTEVRTTDAADRAAGLPHSVTCHDMRLLCLILAVQYVRSRSRVWRPRLPGGYGVTAMASGSCPTLIGLSAVLVAVRIGVTVSDA